MLLFYQGLNMKNGLKEAKCKWWSSVTSFGFAETK